jgi:hypothetical protein
MACRTRKGKAKSSISWSPHFPLLPFHEKEISKLKKKVFNEKPSI